MLLLAIDTSTSAVTVALHDGSAVVAEVTTIDARRHTELAAAHVVEVLAAAGRTVDEVTRVVVGVGPGPFTGLRVGLSTARTFAFARGVPVGGVCSLDILAHQVWQERGAELGGGLVVATDARRKEVYTARYALSPEGMRRTREPEVLHADVLARSLDGAVVAGRGALLYPALLGPGVPPLDASAGALASLAVAALQGGGDLVATEPMYLRRPDVSPASPRKHALS